MPGETKKICPRCGKKMDDFAAVWGWKHCYHCATAVVKERIAVLVGAAAQKKKAGEDTIMLTKRDARALVEELPSCRPGLCKHWCKYTKIKADWNEKCQLAQIAKRIWKETEGV